MPDDDQGRSAPPRPAGILLPDPPPARSTRALWLGVLLSLLLHLLALFGGLRWPAVQPSLTELTVSLAPVRQPAPPALLPHPPAPAKPLRPPRAPSVRKPPAVPVAPPLEPVAMPELPSAPPPEAAPGVADASPGGAPAVEPAPPAALPGDAVPAPSPAPLASAAPPRREPWMDLPKEGEVDYRVTKGEGEWRAGRGTLRWKVEGDHYHLELEAHAEGLPGLIYWGVMRWTSDGQVLPDRLRPELFMRSDKEGVRFDWSAHTLTFLPSGFVRPLPDGGLDLLSVFFQFALRPPADDTLDFPVTNGDKLDRYVFELTERGRLKLALGELDTIHISRVHQVQENGFEIWLGIDRDFLPVQMRLYHARYGVLNLYATGIRVNGLPGRLQEP